MRAMLPRIGKITQGAPLGNRTKFTTIRCVDQKPRITISADPMISATPINTTSQSPGRMLPSSSRRIELD
jgi:hypothetical protein